MTSIRTGTPTRGSGDIRLSVLVPFTVSVCDLESAQAPGPGQGQGQRLLLWLWK